MIPVNFYSVAEKNIVRPREPKPIFVNADQAFHGLINYIDTKANVVILKNYL